VMYRRPSRDRNYEFWGDQTFFGENPPQAAVIAWMNRRDVGDVRLRIADAAGRSVREISGPVLAAVNKAGIQSACWDLRVQPAPAPPLGAGGRGGGRGEQAGGQAGRGGQSGEGQQTPQRSPFGAGCPVGGGTGFGAGGGFGGGGATIPGPLVLPGVYTVELIVDGKTIDSKPLRVAADPDVVLTSIERKRMFDMAMEMHDLQRRGAEVAGTLAPISRQMPEITKTVEGRTDLPADVKSAVEAFNKELSAATTRFAALTSGGGRGGGGAGGRGGTGPENPLARIGQAKQGLMAGMPPTEQTTRAYASAKAEAPKVYADAAALVTKARDLSATLANYNITLNVGVADPGTASR
jgi:hypothetical protein